jgi:hypothetical protein
VARNLLSVKLTAETTGTGTGSNDTKVDSTNNSTLGGSPPVAPPPSEPKNNTAEHSLPANVPLGPAPSSQDASTGAEAKSAQGGTCTRDRGPVIASLAVTGGDGEDGKHQVLLSGSIGGLKVNVMGVNWSG